VIVETVAGGNVAGFIAHEHISPRPRRLHVQVRHLQIYNVNNGERFATYVIGGQRRGEVVLNGAAARLVQPGDEVIIAAYASFEPAEAARHQPVVVLLDARNRPRRKRERPATRSR